MLARSLTMPVLLLSAFALIACTKGSSRPVDPQEAFGMVKNRLAVLIDVREREELSDGMAWGAEWMPLSKIKENHSDWQTMKQQLPADKMVIFYCGSGNRAGKVAKMLKDDGFQTGNMGGFQEWQKAGLPVEPCKVCPPPPPQSADSDA